MSRPSLKKKPRHGLRYHPLYGRWLGMHQRCSDPAHVGYDLYGGKGVKVCERWHSFPNFLADMGTPEKGWSIERLDAAGDYEPKNCVWATAEQQTRNKSSNRFYEYAGKRQCMADWAKDLGINHTTLSERIAKWSIDRALSTPNLRNKEANT